MKETFAIIWDGTPESAETVLDYFKRVEAITARTDKNGSTILSIKTAFGTEVIRTKDCPLYIVEHRPGFFITMSHNEYMEYLEGNGHD